MFLLDANVIIRFLTNDDSVQSPLAYQLFKKVVDENLTLILHPLVVAECCYVLESIRYGFIKKDIAEKFLQLTSSSNIKTVEKIIVQNALVEYSHHNVDFTDAYLAASVNHNAEFHSTITWNQKDFKRLSTEFYSPEEFLLRSNNEDKS